MFAITENLPTEPHCGKTSLAGHRAERGRDWRSLFGALVLLAATIAPAAPASAKISGTNPFVKQAELSPTDEIGHVHTSESATLSSTANIAPVDGHNAR